ncbi:MAG: hypothetical protein V4640_00040 [Verrucomicrobiota bacterium]
MSANNNSWFHCGRCGSLFQSHFGESDDRLCPSCGCNPSIGTEAPAPQPLAAASSIPVSLPEPHSRKKASVRPRKGSHFMVYIMLGWIALLVAIVFAARHFWGDNTPETPILTAAAAKALVPPKDLALLTNSAPERSAALTGFLTAGNPENRNQFVSSPITTAARMARFYGMNPMPDIDPATLAMRASSVVMIPGKTAIESQLDSADGRLFDVAFLRENDEWKIDWDHFVRYSETPWPLFLSGSGDAEAEFRLLVRERLAEERKDADTLSLVFYAPRFGYANETGLQSPEFIIPRESRDGRLLEAAFALQKSGDRVFGSKLPDLNPEGLVRVRVKIRRSEVDKTRRFELTEIIACHWYSDDHPGVEPVVTHALDKTKEP